MRLKQSKPSSNKTTINCQKRNFILTINSFYCFLVWKMPLTIHRKVPPKIHDAFRGGFVPKLRAYMPPNIHDAAEISPTIHDATENSRCHRKFKMPPNFVQDATEIPRCHRKSTMLSEAPISA